MGTLDIWAKLPVASSGVRLHSLLVDMHTEVRQCVHKRCADIVALENGRL